MTKNLKFWKICTQRMNFYLVKVACFRCKMKMFLRYLYKVPKDFTLLTKIVFSFHLQVSHSYTNKTNCFWSKIIFSVGGAARGQVGVRLLIFTCRPLLAAGWGPAQYWGRAGAEVEIVLAWWLIKCTSESLQEKDVWTLIQHILTRTTWLLLKDICRVHQNIFDHHCAYLWEGGRVIVEKLRNLIWEMWQWQ